MDPSWPAVRGWLLRAVADLFGLLLAFLAAGWAAGQYVFPRGAPARFLLGLLTVSVALALLSPATRAGVRRNPSRSGSSPIASSISRTARSIRS